MARLPDDRFRIFVSHKHEDHALAATFKEVMEGLSDKFECFVSGVNISAGSDWNREIKTKLAQSHLLVLLFTRPTHSWDWCLFETGLFTRSDAEDVSAVVCLFDPSAGTPGPLASLQGVAARPDTVKRFLTDVCTRTWLVSDDWRLGAVAPRVKDALITRAAERIVRAFPDGPKEDTSYFPCHQVVLDLDGIEELGDGIPDAARVVEGQGATSSFTLSVFNLAGGRRTLTWADLVEAVGGRESGWRQQLDRRFVAALNEELFTPITAAVRAWSQGRRDQRMLKPVLYRIDREPTQPGETGGSRMRGRPTGVTIVFDPLSTSAARNSPELNLVRINARFQVEVLDEFIGRVHERSRESAAVFDDIQEALQLVYEDADRYGIFDEGELRRVYAEDFEGRGIDTMGSQWDAIMQELHAALEARDTDVIETHLLALGELNRTFSILSTERYLKALQTRAV